MVMFNSFRLVANLVGRLNINVVADFHKKSYPTEQREQSDIFLTLFDRTKYTNKLLMNFYV